MEEEGEEQMGRRKEEEFAEMSEARWILPLRCETEGEKKRMTKERKYSMTT